MTDKPEEQPVKKDANDVARELGPEGLRREVEERTAASPDVSALALADTAKPLSVLLGDPSSCRLPRAFRRGPRL